jgi:hypothetical protein
MISRVVFARRVTGGFPCQQIAKVDTPAFLVYPVTSLDKPAFGS